MSPNDSPVHTEEGSRRISAPRPESSARGGLQPASTARHARRAAAGPGAADGQAGPHSPLFDGESDPRFWKCILRVDAFSQRQICQMLPKFGGLVLGCIEAGLSK